MIPVGRPQHLGTKTLIIMIIRGFMPALLLLLFVIILYFFKDPILANLAQRPMNGGVVMNTTTGFDNFIPIFIPTIFFLGVLLGAVGILLSALQYVFMTFTLEEFGLKLKRGILHVEEITIPYRQMQNVDVTRPLIYRLFGLSRLVIFSAGHEKQDGIDETSTVFDSMDCEIAEEIRTLLGRRIGVQVIEAEEEADREELAARSQPAPDL